MDAVFTCIESCIVTVKEKVFDQKLFLVCNVLLRRTAGISNHLYFLNLPRCICLYTKTKIKKIQAIHTTIVKPR